LISIPDAHAADIGDPSGSNVPSPRKVPACHMRAVGIQPTGFSRVWRGPLSAVSLARPIARCEHPPRTKVFVMASLQPSAFRDIFLPYS
jgi:hypothetical protein